MAERLPREDARCPRLLDTPAEMRRAGRLGLCVDPRMELLAVIQWFSTYGTRFPLLTRLDFDYKADVVAHFTPYADHEAVRQLDAMLDRPFSMDAPPFAFGAPPEVMLYVGSGFALDPAIDAQAFLVDRAGGRSALDAFVASLQDFYEVTGFAGFFERHRATYRAVLARTARKLGSYDEIARLEAFYGFQQGSYTIVLVPLYHAVGFGPHRVVDGVRHLFSILGPADVSGGLPDFGSETYFRHMQRHEFSHSFVNPLTAAQWSTARLYFTGYASVEEAQEVVNESVIRAVTTWFAYEDDPERGRRALEHELDQGFPAVAPLLEKIRDYAANRDRYPSLDRFYPHLLLAFEGHVPSRYTARGRAETS